MSGINYINIAEFIEKNARAGNFLKEKYVLLPFYKDGVPLTGKRWGMTLLAAPSMRFRWNEKNEERTKLLKSIIAENCKSVCSGACVADFQKCDCKHKIAGIELIHSKTVFSIKSEEDCLNRKGDGLVTDNSLLVPVVTVADCVPLFLYDSQKGVSGAVHSGWKGTGIIRNAIQTAVEEYGSKPEDICVAIGPHICSRCYCVDEERRNYFLENFGECVRKSEKRESELQKTKEGRLLNYELSLTDANPYAIKQAGIPEENITVATDCTCCTTFSNGKNVYGSFRRQAAFLPDSVDDETRKKSMTVQAAFVL